MAKYKGTYHWDTYGYTLNDGDWYSNWQRHRNLNTLNLNIYVLVSC